MNVINRETVPVSPEFTMSVVAFSSGEITLDMIAHGGTNYCKTSLSLSAVHALELARVMTINALAAQAIHKKDATRVAQVTEAVAVRAVSIPVIAVGDRP